MSVQSRRVPRQAYGYREVALALRQSGPRVTGELVAGGDVTQVEGIVNGEVVSFRAGEMEGELIVDGEEMTGTARGQVGRGACPCTFRLRRETSAMPAPLSP